MSVLYAPIISESRGVGSLVVTRQPKRPFTEAEIEFGYVATGYPEKKGAPVLVCMVPTLTRRHGRLQGIDLIVVDECHHAIASTWRPARRAGRF